jgi:iron(III) transport system permease protein
VYLALCFLNQRGSNRKGLPVTGRGLIHWVHAAKPPYWLRWQTVVLVMIITFMLWEVVVPLALVVWTSLKTLHPGDLGFLDFVFTLENYRRAFASNAFAETSINTLIFSLTTTFFAFTMAAFLAWVAVRTDTPGAHIIGMLTFGRIFIPSVITASAWVFIASPRLGILNHMIQPIFGRLEVINVYSFPWMVFIQSLEMVPLAYLLLATGFRTMDPRLEEASIMTGAGTWRTFRNVTLPLNLPSVLAAVFLLLITSIEALEVPALIGFRARISVYSLEMYNNTRRAPTDWGLASTYGMALMAISLVLLAAYLWLTRENERYQTITGKDFRPRRIELGRWGYVTCAISIVILLLMTGIPLLALIYTSLLEHLQQPSMAAFQDMTLDNFRNMMRENSREMRSLWNSFQMSSGTAGVAVLLASAIAYFVHKTHLPGRRFLDFLAFAPIAIPSVLIGTAFMWIYLLVPFDILETLLIIGLGMLVKYLPFALRFVSAAILRVHGELEEAAQVSGASWLRNLVRIYLPLLRPGLIAAFIWVMVNSYRDVPIAGMLSRTANRTAAETILSLSGASWLRLSAFGVTMFGILIFFVGLIYWIGHRNRGRAD